MKINLNIGFELLLKNLRLDIDCAKIKQTKIHAEIEVDATIPNHHGRAVRFIPVGPFLPFRARINLQTLARVH